MLGVFVLIKNIQRNGGVGIAKIALAVAGARNGTGRGLVIAKRCPENPVKLALNFIVHGISSAFCKLLHISPYKLAVFVAEVIYKPLQITRNKYIHRRGCRGEKFTVAVIGPGADKISKNIVAV